MQTTGKSMRRPCLCCQGFGKDLQPCATWVSKSLYGIGRGLRDRRIRQELVPDDVTTGDERQTASATAKSEETCSQTKAGQAFLNNFRFCVHGPEEPSPSPKSYRESLQSLQAALRCNRLADQGRHQGSEGQDRAFRPAAQTQNCPES